ncbi:hypothetical protein EJ063_02195 [Vibrio aquaticus]|uniref:Lipoprotein n=1 Tax=Vibrio aquaticus TaxID=2496559 RepID=A0A432D138_9VIBR|nr:hypothetical protein [Vibrio aquaticus]RTZ17619.1 hypothetical protein EJ063_02195 [Vibrio aquaticus]
MKKQITLLLSLLSLTACGSLAIMDKSEAIKAQPEMLIKTDGDLWGLGGDGQFTLGATYQGKYSRDASSSTWFNTISTKDGEMAAEVTNKESGKTWLLSCNGGGTSFKFNMLQIGGNAPYTCAISLEGESAGTFVLERDAKMIDFGTEDKEMGSIVMGEQRFDVETVHTGSGLMMPLEKALGYRFTLNGQEVAAVQTNGVLTVQWLPEMTPQQRDVLAVGAIASALSWRPEE